LFDEVAGMITKNEDANEAERAQAKPLF